MLENLSEGFTAIISRIRGQSRLSEANVTETMGLIRDTLVNADVSLPVVEDFVEGMKPKALGHQVLGSITPGQALIKLVNDELVELMGAQAARLIVPGDQPRVILMCGLQGSGKTTTTAKLALNLKNSKKRILAASCDVHRPAAIEQLRVLSQDIGVDFHEPAQEDSSDAVRRATSALESAGQTLHDYVLVDTAGRNVIDDEMMAEIKSVSQSVSPSETLLVIDATLGQEALAVAKGFSEDLALTGICLSKLDGDARGGAAMSARATLGIPVKFIGVGEKPEDLQAFDPARMASRILGMGDIVSLVESATAAMGKSKVEKLERKLRKRKSPGLELSDMIEQMRQAEKLGGIDKMVDHLPAKISQKIKAAEVEPKVFRRMEAIYLSMTGFERRNPSMIKATRKIRIAKGSGVEVQQVNQLLTQHAQANKIMRKARKNPAAAMSMMRGMLR